MQGTRLRHLFLLRSPLSLLLSKLTSEDHLFNSLLEQGLLFGQVPIKNSALQYLTLVNVKYSCRETLQFLQKKQKGAGRKQTALRPFEFLLSTFVSSTLQAACLGLSVFPAGRLEPPAPALCVKNPAPRTALQHVTDPGEPGLELPGLLKGRLP